MATVLDTAFLNGAFVPVTEAGISPLDRGFLFGDAIYEVLPIYGGQPFLLDAHLARLDHSLRELGIGNPHSTADWRTLIDELLRRNGGGDMSVYLQVSRGADTGRDQVFPEAIPPTVFAMAMPLQDTDYSQGVAAITLPDLRWGRCDIKSTSLLANVLARETARQQGAVDAILLKDGCVTEAAVSSVIVVEQKALVRRGNSQAILPGTTTDFVVDLAVAAGFECREDAISESRLRAADEIWLTGATKGVAPVVTLDGTTVGDGRPGEVWRQVEQAFRASRRV